MMYIKYFINEFKAWLYIIKQLIKWFFRSKPIVDKNGCYICKHCGTPVAEDICWHCGWPQRWQ